MAKSQKAFATLSHFHKLLDEGRSNKRVDWNYSSNLISTSRQALITAGRVDFFFICVVEKTGTLKIFLKINIRVG